MTILQSDYRSVALSLHTVLMYTMLLLRARIIN